MRKKSTIILLFLLLGMTPTASADTNSSVVQSSVSVSSSDGVSNTRIKTVINGETVEDIDVSTTTPYRRESRYTSDDGRSTSYTDVSINNNEINAKGTGESRTALLTALLNELQTLLAYYEKLLAEQQSRN